MLTSESHETEFNAFVKQSAEPPMYAHWRAFFGEQIKPLGSAADRDGTGLFLQQLLDDRMPAMSFVAVDDPGTIHSDDEDRLPAFDTPGLDYDLAFRDSERATFRYTRFRHLETTYYCNGTSFSMICNTGSFSNVLLTHFRRHYAHLGVIAQYQHAALLYFADELADIAKDLAGRDDEKRESAWRERIRELQHRFLKFRTRSYFTEVSNQMQGKDLFTLWVNQLGTKELFDRVAQTSSEVYEALENHEMKELTKVQKDLAIIATIGLSVSVVLAWAALFPDAVRANPQFTHGVVIWGPWKWLGLSVIISLLCFCGLARRLGFKLKSSKRGD